MPGSPQARAGRDFVGNGAVDEIRPYLAHAKAAVAPLRVARGVQNKVLEAMAMAKPVLATPAALDGIRGADGVRELASDDPATLAQLGIELLSGGDSGGLGAKGRELVLRHYAWSQNLKRLEALLRGESVGQVTEGRRREAPAISSRYEERRA